jgi:hypothetical protein
VVFRAATGIQGSSGAVPGLMTSIHLKIISLRPAETVVRPLKRTLILPNATVPRPTMSPKPINADGFPDNLRRPVSKRPPPSKGTVLVLPPQILMDL